CSRLSKCSRLTIRSTCSEHSLIRCQSCSVTEALASTFVPIAVGLSCWFVGFVSPVFFVVGGVGGSFEAFPDGWQDVLNRPKVKRSVTRLGVLPGIKVRFF